MLTIDHDTIAKMQDRLATHALVHGIGTAEASCSVAALNIVLTGRVDDDCPACMSDVIHRWVIRIQDAMPLDRINAPRWKSLLPYAAGTGKAHEAERVAIMLDWMWGTVLPQFQPLADAKGFGAEWRDMCEKRTEAAAAQAAGAAAGWAGLAAAWAGLAAGWAAQAARAEWAALAARAAAWAALASAPDYWAAVNPEALLERLILVSVTADEMRVPA